MDVFDFRDRLIRDYTAYTQGFIQIRDERISQTVQQVIAEGALWPRPLIQLNPSFEVGDSVDELVSAGVLLPECANVFRKGKDEPAEHGRGRPLRLHRHQSDAVKVAVAGNNYILTTGTGSGKSLAYIIPIVNHVLKHGSGRGIQAIVVYPMNALANSQMGELRKFLPAGYPDGKGPVTFERYTGQENDEEKSRIMGNPPDILLTNYVMLELILTRPEERKTLVRAAKGLRFLVLDELHTYRGRQGADVAMLVRRVREALQADALQCVGTSATLAGAGSFEEQRGQVAEVGSNLFGVPVRPENVIGETLRRATPARDPADPAFQAALSQRLAASTHPAAADYAEFVKDPLSIWLESTFGLANEQGTGRLIRAKPRTVRGDEGAAKELAQSAKLPEEQCARAIEQGLLAGYQVSSPQTGFPAFAFKVHQFISRGDTVYASLDAGAERYITVYGQKFVPDHRDKVLMPLAFCRECGQEYFTVRMKADSETKSRTFLPRELTDLLDHEDLGEAGYLYYSSDAPWPSGTPQELDLLPDEWTEIRQSGQRLKPAYRDKVPMMTVVGPDGQESDQGVEMHYFPAPFRFCLRCGIYYGGRVKSDFAQLSTLGSEGRSTATTILALSAIRSLKKDDSLLPEARKLLSFTDNRQDASLQAGHFNDFVEIAVLRAALYRAVAKAGADGIHHEHLTQRVFEALNLPVEAYASNPGARFAQKIDTDRSLRDVLGYRLYHDLRRGWRITSPNLEQCGLLEIKYVSLDELSQAEDLWAELHPALVSASAEIRARVAKVLLDYMRRELAIKVDYLNDQSQESIKQQSGQRLIPPWSIDESEEMEHSAILFPRPSSGADYGNVFLSARGGFGQFLRRSTTFSQLPGRLSTDDIETVIKQLLQVLETAGLVSKVEEPHSADDVPGYQMLASAMIWQAGDGAHAFQDPIRIPRASEVGGRTNPFFVEFYRTIAAELRGIEAREHTAQVPSLVREEREKLFRAARLPVLFCSPTMELGVDISELNVVNMRNVPPTPANYAQRSGRSGRGGQPAFVFSYCSVGSPHDQYFFKRPELMVAGAVSPPRLDLANEDLVRAHVHAIWLAEAGTPLGNSLRDILVLSPDDLTLPLNQGVRDDFNDPQVNVRARRRAGQVLATIRSELDASGWYVDRWLDDVLEAAPLRFEQACERWRGLYQSAMKQRDAQDAIARDASRPPEDRRQAQRLRYEAESQLELLTQAENLSQSDFYSYRYFASEGFLPGYSFPRLPLSAYIPGRRLKTDRDEFLSRPRFLAISEFGPRSIIYHEGSRYLINRVMLAVGEGQELKTNQAKLCPVCGYLHPVTGAAGADQCQRCGEPLDQTLRQLFRLQNVATKRRDRISSDEEERFRLGYELRTAVRFTDYGVNTAVRTAGVKLGDTTLATLTYGQAATLWRINLGWKRRQNRQLFGFMLDIERGFWAKNDQQPDDGADDALSARMTRVIPYVEDTRNCLLFEPAGQLDQAEMASLQAALKTAIQVQFQLEDGELAAEPLPDDAHRHLLLVYESAEGGAGVLRRLVDDASALAAVARKALEICHFDPASGADRHRGERARENCEAACYDCLMSYYNQRDHALLDRQRIKDLLMQLAAAEVNASPVAASRSDHLQTLLNLCGSDLEREWLKFLDEKGYRLPSKAQPLIETCRTRPDFLYQEATAAIYVDGPHHEYPERQARDQNQSDCMEDAGYTVIRFNLSEDWASVIGRYPNVFGRSTSP